MHSTIGHIGMQINRKGRKRKMGRRTASGAPARIHVDYLTLAAQNPDRRDLPPDKRLSEKAASLLGRFNLLSHITDEQYEAGRRYSVVVGAYLAMANAPRGLAGTHRGQGCAGALNCPADTCRCLVVTERYMDAYEAVERAGGHAVHLAVKRVAIHDQSCHMDELGALRLGLSALANHFGLTNGPKFHNHEIQTPKSRRAAKSP